MKYNGVEITEKNGKFRLTASNGTLRIFNTIEMAKHFIDNEETLESHRKALHNDCWN